MLAYAYAAKFLARWQQADRVRERQAAQRRRDRLVGAHRFNNQERHRYNRARGTANSAADTSREGSRGTKKRDDKPLRWERQRR
jgi:hypothetical protein